MTVLRLLGTIGFVLWMLRNISFWVALFQVKEYRLDRLLVHIRETRQGRALIFSRVSLIKWLLLLGFIYAVFFDGITWWITMAVFLLYSYEGGVVCFEISNHLIKRPIPTGKAVAISFLSVLVLGVVFLFPLVDYAAWLLFLDRIVLVVIGLFVFFFAFPTELYVDWKIQKASEQIRKQKKLLVIAVSGSYGKSSTKEFIAQVLSSTFSVVKTKGSNNTPIGIAQTILQKITSQTDIFVVEMGAYKKGEIAQLAAMVPPAISVTTSVSDQHLSLYGSVEHAMETEMELINALPKTGIALFNGNNENTLKLFSQTTAKKVLYQMSDEPLGTMKGILATNVRVGKDGIHCDVTKGTEKLSISVPLLGKHMIENVLPAVYIALHLGIPKKSILASLSQLTPPDKTMTAQITEDGVTIVDDTFNASPESVFAAMNYMQVYKHKKIFVLTPLIELGKHAKIRHNEIGFQAATLCDYLFLTNTNFYDDILKGIMRGKGGCIVKTMKPVRIANELKTLSSQGDVIVFEGKESGFARKKYL